MKKYEKPKVLSVGYYPEPVEAGCCLRSCGGSPGGRSGTYLTRGAKSTLKLLKKSIK